MRFVLLDPVMDPAQYLAELVNLRDELPAAAYDFASDAGHYDFYGSRCVKDLTLSTFRMSNGSELGLEIHFDPNKWKHDAALAIAYEQVSSVVMSATGSGPVGPTLLGSVILDEVLPHSGGVSHELAFHGGTLKIVCRDLKARWTEVK